LTHKEAARAICGIVAFVIIQSLKKVSCGDLEDPAEYGLWSFSIKDRPRILPQVIEPTTDNSLTDREELAYNAGDFCAESRAGNGERTRP
jgi:hypothetical protein